MWLSLQSAVRNPDMICVMFSVSPCLVKFNIQLFIGMLTLKRTLQACMNFPSGPDWLVLLWSSIAMYFTNQVFTYTISLLFWMCMLSLLLQQLRSLPCKVTSTNVDKQRLFQDIRCKCCCYTVSQDFGSTKISVFHNLWNNYIAAISLFPEQVSGVNHQLISTELYELNTKKSTYQTSYDSMLFIAFIISVNSTASNAGPFNAQQYDIRIISSQ